MRKLVLLILAVICFSSGKTMAQSARISPHGGFTYQFIKLKERSTGAVGMGYYYGISGGLHYVIMHSNDQFALGADPNVNFSFAFSGAGTSLLVQTPVFLTMRVGAGATPFNESKVGVGVGAGLNFSYLNESGTLRRFSQGFLSSAAMAELVINGRSSTYAIRVNFTPVQTITVVDGSDLYFNNFGLGILYSF